MNLKRLSPGHGENIPPTLFQVHAYFCQKKIPEEEADRFFDKYSGLDWKHKGGKPIRNWKEEASKWIWGILVRNRYLRSK